MEPVIDELREETRAHKRNVLERDHLIPNRFDNPIRNEKMANFFSHVAIDSAKIPSCTQQIKPNKSAPNRKSSMQEKPHDGLDLSGTSTAHIAFQTETVGTYTSSSFLKYLQQFLLDGFEVQTILSPVF